MTLVMLLLYIHAAVAYSVVEVINTVAASDSALAMTLLELVILLKLI